MVIKKCKQTMAAQGSSLQTNEEHSIYVKKMGSKLALKFTDENLQCVEPSCNKTLDEECCSHFVFDINNWYSKWTFDDPIFLDCQSERLFLIEYGDDTTKLLMQEEVTTNNLRHLFTRDELRKLLKLNVNGLLEFFASKCCIDVMEFLLDQGADISHNIDRPLQIASAFGHLDVVKFLVEHGAHIQQYHYRVLEVACYYGHLHVVKYLVEQGATIRANFATWAAKGGHLDVVKFLFEHGADIHDKNDCALVLASECGHLDVVKYLVEHGADIHAKKIDPFTAFDTGSSALCVASLHGQLDVVKYLVVHGADIHDENECALLNACEGGHLGVVEYLAEHGADIHVKVDAPVAVASECGHLDVVQFLVDHGADILAGKEAKSLRNKEVYKHIIGLPGFF